MHIQALIKRILYDQKYDIIIPGLSFTNFNVAKRATSPANAEIALLFYPKGQ